MVVKNTPRNPQQAGTADTHPLDKLLEYKVPIIAMIALIAVGAIVIAMLRSSARQAELDAWHDANSAASRSFEALLEGKGKDDLQGALNEIEAKLAKYSDATVAPTLLLYKARLQAGLDQGAAAKETIAAMRAKYPAHPFVAAVGDAPSPADALVAGIEAKEKFLAANGKPFADRPKPQAGLSATITFKDFGDVKLGFFPQYAPEHVANFLRLAREGFYDGTTIHRITAFCIQGGDPNSKNDDPKDDGQGGPGYTVENEARLNPLQHTRGTLSAARAGRDAPDSGSQFFICTRDAKEDDFLENDRYTAYGEVLEGMDIVDKIFQQPTKGQNTDGVAPDRPVNPIVIEKIVIEGDFSLPETEMPGYLERKKKAEEDAEKKDE